MKELSALEKDRYGSKILVLGGFEEFLKALDITYVYYYDKKPKEHIIIIKEARNKYYKYVTFNELHQFVEIHTVNNGPNSFENVIKHVLMDYFDLQLFEDLRVHYGENVFEEKEENEDE